jgi:hypothetical protein
MEDALFLLSKVIREPVAGGVPRILLAEARIVLPQV